ncbi:MAG: peptidoglycan-associated lipoprotein Pal [Desulfuromonadaceae bacterium]
MTIRTFIATTIICSFVALTGCATKQVTTVDSVTPPAASTPTATSPVTAVMDKAAEGVMTNAVLGESIPKSGETTEQIDKGRAETHLDPVYFDFESYLLGVEARETLTRNARWLNENRVTRVVIEGHSDERGSDEYNLALAEKRALAARRYIETLGVSLDRMETVSYGENKPAVVGHDEAAFAKNRRAEFVIVK